MSRRKIYTAEEMIERRREARRRWKQKNKAKINALQNGANGNQTECLEAKRFIRTLMGGKCENCGMVNYEKTVGHHAVPVGEELSSDSPRNLVCLCRGCHAMVHKMLKNKREDYDELMMKLFAEREPYKRISIEKYEEARK